MSEDNCKAHIEKRDNWQHRTATMKCRTCMWYAPKLGHIGRCRRHAPTMNGWPVMFESDWCGDHKLNENWEGNQ